MIDKKIRLIELFAGVGSQAMALRTLCKANGLNPDDVFETYRVVEFDKYPVQSYNAIHKTNIVPTDITQITGKDLGIVDVDKYEYIMTYSFPCFTGDTLVLTKDGLKEIENIQIGDEVLSHDNKYHRVKESGKTGEKEIYKLTCDSIKEIKCTKNHKFYVKRIEEDKPRWLSLEDLMKLKERYYLGLAINQEAEFPKLEGLSDKYIRKYSFWWLIGRFYAEKYGNPKRTLYLYGKKYKIDNKINPSSVFDLYCTKVDLIPILNNITDCELEYTIKNNGDTISVEVQTKDIVEIAKSLTEEIPGYIYNLPKEYLKSFLEGYNSFSKDNKDILFTRKLKIAYGLGQIIMKAYNVPYKLTKKKDKLSKDKEDDYTIKEEYYQLEWRRNELPNKEDTIWIPIEDIQETGEILPVYDITVENSHSFTANNIIVHNCQDLSIAGKGRGMEKGSGTRSGLLWEVERLLNEVENLPQVLIMENVPMVHSEKNLETFNLWCDFLASKGYHSEWEDLNSKDYCIPQSRERTFMVSTLEDMDYMFPRPVGLRLDMKDLLDEEVEEKYYIHTDKAEEFIAELSQNGQLDALIKELEDSGQFK